MWASDKGNTDTAKILVENGADINAKEDDKFALLMASEEGHIYIVKMLLEKELM